MAIKTPYVPVRASFLEKEILKRVRKSLDLTSTELQELTDAEVQQLQAIGTTTISAAQWGYLGELATSILSMVHGNISSITDDYTASYYDVLLCDGTFTVTLPDITSDDLGKPVTIINVGTGIITGDGNGDDTFYGEKTIEARAEDTLLLKPATTSTWRLH